MKICQKCGHEIECPYIFCPHCETKVEYEFSIFCFVKENFRYFEAIGIVATILTLLPLFGDVCLGVGWQFEKDSIAIVPFVFTVLSGLILILIIFSILIFNRLWINRDIENHNNPSWLLKQSDRKRIGFLIFFSVFILPFIAFFYSVLLLIKNDVAYLMVLFCSIIFCIVLLYLIVIWLNLKVIDHAERTLPPRQYKTLIITMGILLACITATITMSPQTVDIHQIFGESKYPSNVSLDFDNQYCFNPYVSTTNGIPLIPTNIADNNKLTLPHWHTNYGYIVSETFPDKKTKIEGIDAQTKKDSINVKKKVFWTYPPTKSNEIKSNVSITFGAIPLASNKPISTVSVTIYWIDNDTACVDPSTLVSKNYPFIPAENMTENFELSQPISQEKNPTSDSLSSNETINEFPINESILRVNSSAPNQVFPCSGDLIFTKCSPHFSKNN